MRKKQSFQILTIGFLIISFAFVLISGKNNNSKSQFIGLKSDLSDNWAKEKLANLTLEEKIGQFFMVSAYSNQGEKHLAEIEKQVIEDKVGGIIFFQGERENLVQAINRFQSKTKIPLLIGLDAEWGIQMRIFGEKRFPYAYTIGAADDLNLTERVGEMMAQECKEVGIHLNFSPVADVNSNPENPVIGFRSFGEDPEKVAKQVSAMVQGMENNGILTSIKHFPGHGNTDKDSHLELPSVSSTLKTIKTVDFVPFNAGIKAGAGSVMVGHLNINSLDNSGTPSSLSSKIIKGYLQDSLGFKGLVISDALNMKAVADKYGKTEVVVKAFEAGCDILLFPESISEAIKAIASKVKNGEISKTEIDLRCLKVLKAKHKYIIQTKTTKHYTEGEIEWAKTEVYEKALTVLKNENNVLPLKRMDQKIARISIGGHTSAFREGIDRFSKIDHFHYYSVEEANERIGEKLKHYDVIITAFHANSIRPKNDFGMPEGWRSWLGNLPKTKQNIVFIFGNPLVLKEKNDFSNIQSVVVGYENNPILLERASQLLFGAIEVNGKLPFTISNDYKIGDGQKVEWGGRLKFSQPEEFGLLESDFKEVDRLANNGIQKGAFPGCQIVVALEGKIIYQKSYGTKTYEDSVPVKNTDVYDIASVTKIAGSTFGVMKLQTQGKFSCDKKLKDYIPEITGEGDFGNILIRDMMTHQAGLTPWIPFYKRTLKDGELNSSIYSKTKKKGFDKQVAENMWIKDSYTDTIYKQILNSTLNDKKYVYSDLGYYFIKKIVEKQSDLSFEDYLMRNLYNPMGLQYMRYLPRNYFPLSQIVPTENDKAFRKQQIHGFVHDPGAAMLGGVGGHAGLFSNATDLASVMQVFLNKGFYGGVSYLNSDVVNEFTKCQFCPGNRRGLGFDRPNNSGGGTCHEIASSSSFGHSGFTGTLVWADPSYKINYVFLSNRVYQDQDNWKIRDMNIRTDIQKAIYDAIAKIKKK
ncbi:MAG: serine hydrolase [Flavobacteriia bacterium]|nr:serine hydrolase [Flavobacteriia bacterium]